jgi:hypothetical protein
MVAVLTRKLKLETLCFQLHSRLMERILLEID